MPTEPAIKRAVAFVDGQNLFYAAKTAFGYNHPNEKYKATFDANKRKCPADMRLGKRLFPPISV